MPTSSVTTSNLLFACAEHRGLRAIQREGLPAGTELFSHFEDAQRHCSECIVVLTAYAEEEAVARPEAIKNLGPYADPRPVTAAGGFVVRELAGKPAILLIFRRGLWDLPKGKLDAGESIEDCARREVCEEVGIGDVEITAPLGQTIHGYRDGSTYAVKTTHWFAMRTDAESFTPQRKEKIEKVEWVPLPDARERLAFETLRRHLDAVGSILTS